MLEAAWLPQPLGYPPSQTSYTAQSAILERSPFPSRGPALLPPPPPPQPMPWEVLLTPALSMQGSAPLSSSPSSWGGRRDAVLGRGR